MHYSGIYPDTLLHNGKRLLYVLRYIHFQPNVTKLPYKRARDIIISERVQRQQHSQPQKKTHKSKTITIQIHSFDVVSYSRKYKVQAQIRTMNMQLHYTHMYRVHSHFP